MSLSYNSIITLVAAGLFVALGFALNPVLGVALMVLESTIVLTNLYLFKQQDILSSTSSNANNAVEVEPTANTTSKVLHALGHRSQPQENLAIVTESKPVNPKVINLFAPKEHSSYRSDVTQQKLGCGIC